MSGLKEFIDKRDSLDFLVKDNRKFYYLTCADKIREGDQYQAGDCWQKTSNVGNFPFRTSKYRRVI